MQLSIDLFVGPKSYFWRRLLACPKFDALESFAAWADGGGEQVWVKENWPGSRRLGANQTDAYTNESWQIAAAGKQITHLHLQ